VPTTQTRKDLKKLFKQFGGIETIRIRSVTTADPKMKKKVAAIKKEFHPDRNSVNAYVVYKEKASVNKALKSKDISIEGFHLRIDSCSSKMEQKHDHKKCVFVGNLPFAAKEDELWGHFSECGKVADVRLVRDSQTGMGKGFGYVRFQAEESVLFGLKMNGVEFNGRPLRVNRSSENPKGFRPKHGPKRAGFQGLRSTSKKDRERGKKILKGNVPGNDKSKSPKSNNSTNALKRLGNKNVRGGDKNKLNNKKKFTGNDKGEGPRKFRKVPASASSGDKARFRIQGKTKKQNDGTGQNKGQFKKRTGKDIRKGAKFKKRDKS